MLDNWIFAENHTKRSDSEALGNGTCQARAPLRPHNVDDSHLRFQARNALLKRQFQCPAGTASCSSIGAPDVCCGTGLTCINVQGDSDAGSVGCCPEGQTCAGSVSCDSNNGYSACPDAPNGGCCMPGFQCSGVGCKYLVAFYNNHSNHVQALLSARLSSTSYHRQVLPPQPQLQLQLHLPKSQPHLHPPPPPPPQHTPVPPDGSLALPVSAEAAVKTAAHVLPALPVSAPQPAPKPLRRPSAQPAYP